MTREELHELLDTEAERINNPRFIADDPVQFPRRFSDPRDIEIAALLAATIAWGNRKMICRDGDRLMEMMDNAPYRFMMEGAVENLDPDRNIHRTFFVRNLRNYLRGLRLIYERYGSLQDFGRHLAIGEYAAPAWKLVEGINAAIAEANDGCADPQCLPARLDTTALKRVNMALRCRVRDDVIVDMGIWDVITPAQLYIPLDVHVGDVSRQLGLLTRKADDRRSVVELTEALREFRPEDPVIYDYALFGIGMNL